MSPTIRLRIEIFCRLPYVVRPHDDQVEEVPHARVAHVLEDELPDEVVGVVPVAVEEGRQQAKELQFLQNSTFGVEP